MAGAFKPLPRGACEQGTRDDRRHGRAGCRSGAALATLGRWPGGTAQCSARRPGRRAGGWRRRAAPRRGARSASTRDRAQPHRAAPRRDRPAYPRRVERPAPTALEDPIEPLDAVDPEAAGYQAIGEPLNVEDEDLTLEEPLWIGEPLDADDPEAGVYEDPESEVTAVGAPLDADDPPQEVTPAAPPRHIGEPLDAHAPEDL